MASETEPDTLLLGDRTQIDLSNVSLDDGHERYDQRSLLGRGGVGDVQLCRDRRLGRSIAMKTLRPQFQGQSNIELRFLQEAYLQGQLEHPSIVPVYDIGRAPNGQAYFTMKCVRGMTLAQILEGLDDGDPALAQKYSRRRLLSALSNACLALEFAHARGVIHRDLKPANLMLGDFGEVYLLDWGIAKVSGAELVETPVPSPHTAEGSVVGTPGYMAPEQMSSARGSMSFAADIYALGAILFEVLTLEPLHVRGSLGNAIMSTLSSAIDARPSARAPLRDIPPELDAICVKATMIHPEDRYPSARAMSEAIERFLDGDRDLESRKQASLELTESAERTLEMTDAGHERRGEAIQQLSRALALDPSNQRAVGGMVGLLLNPPASLPPEAEESVRLQYAKSQKEAAKTGSRAMLIMSSAFALFFWMGIRDRTAAFATFAMLVVSGIAGLIDARVERPGMIGRAIVYLTGAIAIAMMSRVAGPLLFAPTLMLGLMIPISMTSPRSQLVPIIVVGVAAIAVPFVLELVGALPPSYAFSGGELRVLPQMVRFDEMPALVTLAATSIGGVVAATAVCARILSTHLDADRRLRLHEWYLRKLIRAG